MEITLSLPDVLAAKLEAGARTPRRSTEEVAVALLDHKASRAARSWL